MLVLNYVRELVESCRQSIKSLNNTKFLVSSINHYHILCKIIDILLIYTEFKIIQF